MGAQTSCRLFSTCALYSHDSTRRRIDTLDHPTCGRTEHYLFSPINDDE
jgi:hypothetical protein